MSVTMKLSKAFADFANVKFAKGICKKEESNERSNDTHL